jgi:hypothetical protein
LPVGGEFGGVDVVEGLHNLRGRHDRRQLLNSVSDT